MRLLPPLLGLAFTLAACDLPDIGDSGTTTGGDPGVPSATASASDSASESESDTASASASATSAAPTATAGGECPPFDAGPVGDPHETYSYECFCEGCVLSYEDIPLETLHMFENDGLCECLCEEMGCGGVEGEGGVATGSPSGSDSESDSDCGDTDGGTSGGWYDTEGWGSASATTGSWPDTDGGWSSTSGPTTTDGWPDTAGGVTTDATGK